MLNTSFEVEAGREVVAKWSWVKPNSSGRKGELIVLRPQERKFVQI